MTSLVEALFNVGVKVTHTSDGNFGVSSHTVTADDSQRFSGGTAATDEADVLYSKTRTISASGSENLDLTGALTDAFGATVAAAEVVAIYVKAHAGNANDVVVGGAASNAFNGPLSANGTLTIKPGEFTVLTNKAGWPVVAGTGDILKVANSGAGTSVTYTIVIVGRSVAA